MKFLLILGVVLIHCDISNAYSLSIYENNIGVRICHYISSYVCSVCVPIFFIISGYLFFINIDKFNYLTYKCKLKVRTKTLLIPYIFWCFICCIFLYVKHRFFNMSGLNIFMDDGNVDWINFIKGFWIIDEAEGYPYAFAFWFIRNLIVFVILSPIAWIIGKNIFLTILLFSIYVIFDVNFYGFEWFVLGTYFAITKKKYIRINKTDVFILSIIFWICCLIKIKIGVYNCITFIQVISSLFLAYYISTLLLKNKYICYLSGSTFMIYATHQCYCSKVREYWTQVIGYNNIIQPIIAYFLSMITLLLLGVLFNCIIKNTSSGIYRLLTGGR